MAKKSCVIYATWADQILNLPKDMAGEYIQAILKYAIYGEDLGSDNPAINAMLIPVRKKLDEDNEKYQAQVERMNKNRGQKDINKTSDRGQYEINTISERNHNDVASDTDTVTVTDTVNKYIKKNTKKKNPIHNFPEREIDYEALRNVQQT